MSRPHVDWTTGELHEVAALEASCADTVAALERLFHDAPLPTPERELVDHVRRARSEFLLDLDRRLIGASADEGNTDVHKLLEVLRESREAMAAPIFEHPAGALIEAAFGQPGEPTHREEPPRK